MSYLNTGEKSVPSLVRIFFFGLHLNLGKKCSIFGEDLFFGFSPEFGEKSVPFSVKTFFFGLHLTCSPEQNRGRGSPPPTLKIGQNWGEIANYRPNAQQRSATLGVAIDPTFSDSFLPSSK